MASPLPSSPDRDPYADRRTYPRVELSLPAFLQVDLERHSVKLLDLSNGGAKLTCAARFSAGTAVVLDCGSLTLPAEVRWQNADYLGLSFATTLDQREVAALVARSNALASRMTAFE
ncbi:MAG TPA: PilZ domain-containing protein, partial [Sphingomicrobium sp.]|nr:PilZ domain-containing protein [Sphingomicrobium sp.]